MLLQDGAAAGQSVPHVHVHILPRKNKDFKRNDDIYEELERYNAKDSVSDERGGNELDIERDISSEVNKSKSEECEQIDFKRERLPRTAADMAEESQILRELLLKSDF